ncbi:MAG: hypothetical protein EKE20_17120 [Candidatus Symbiopectobacterium sp. Dall1.0]|nr:hypothetical protein [Candidatus Symbiopectobacterium sp. Dall1.0]
MEIIALSKAYKFEDCEPVNEINIDLDGLTGSDILDIIDLLQAQGHVSVQTSLDNKVHAALAARAIARPVEFINNLPARDFVKVCQKVQNFLLA